MPRKLWFELRKRGGFEQPKRLSVIQLREKTRKRVDEEHGWQT